MAATVARVCCSRCANLQLTQKQALLSEASPETRSLPRPSQASVPPNAFHGRDGLLKISKPEDSAIQAESYPLMPPGTNQRWEHSFVTLKLTLPDDVAKFQDSLRSKILTYADTSSGI